MKTILVAIDLSPGSREVCDAACVLAQSSRSRLVLLHVVTPPPVNLNGLGFATAEVRGMEAELEKRAAHELLGLGRHCERHTGRGVRVVQRTGTAVSTILGKALAVDADLIVLGSHGHGATYDLLIGSTAQAILRRTRVPVLVVPMASG